MSEAASERLVRELARDLRPVRRVARLRVAGLGAAAAGLLAAALALGLSGLRQDLGGLLASAPGFAALFGGLALAAVGGALAALGASVPGRDGVERLGLALLAAAAALGMVAGPLLWVLPAGAASPPWTRDGVCLLGALLVGLAPAAALVGFVSGAAPQRPPLVMGLVVAGAVATGALVVHATCPFAGLRHLVLGHALAPLLAALVLAAPLAWLLRRRLARSGAAQAP